LTDMALAWETQGEPLWTPEKIVTLDYKVVWFPEMHKSA